MDDTPSDVSRKIKGTFCDQVTAWMGTKKII